MNQQVISRNLSLSEKRIEELTYWYAFFMAFSVPTIVFNISIYLFPFLLLALRKKYGFAINVAAPKVFLFSFFLLGVLLSTFHLIITTQEVELINSSIQVIPNYVYWVILVTFIIGHRENFNYDLIFKGFYLGIVFICVYYFFLQDLGLKSLFLFRRISQNNFAFIIISFTPFCVHYLSKKSFFKAIIGSLVLISVGFLSGSRSSSILVMVECVAVLYILNRKAFLNHIPYFFLLPLLIVFVDFDRLIYYLNFESYELIFNAEEVLATDHSFLIRKAMINKAFELYNLNPFWGIGANNFKNMEIDFELPALIWYKFQALSDKSVHNSYAQYLCEFGLAGFVPFMIIVIYGFVKLTFKYFKYRNLVDFTVLVAFTGMCIHNYFISGIVNVYAWFLIGLVYARIEKRNF